ncbi:unnamed protein product [Amoebophrya sp. A120]|nr:unnamed protein product [Amoebophrya sp. A120]|eukprot:GSA120T00011711001.1
MREGQDQREVRTAVRDEVEGGAVAMEVDDDAEEEENQLAEHDVQQPSEQANIEPAERDQIDAEAAEESGEEGDISLGSAADSSKQGDAASPCSAKSASSSSDKKVKSPVAVCAADEAKQQDGVYFAPEQPPLEQAGAERSADVAKNVVPTTAGAVEEQMSSSVNFARSEENGALSPIPEENSSASRLSPVTPGAGQKNGDVGIFAEIQHKRDSQSEKKSARSGGSPDIEQQRQASTPSLAERVPSGATPVFAEGVSSSPVAEGGSTPVLLSQDAQPEEMSASNQQPPRSPASPARTQILEGEQQQPVALTQELSPEKEEAHQEPDVTSHPNVVVQQKSTTTSTAPIVLDETEHSAEGSVLKKIEAQVQAEMAEERRIKEERLRKERQEQEARPRVSQVDLAPKRNSPGKNSFVGSRGSSGSSSRIITEEEALAIAAQRRAAERKAEQDRRAEAEKEKEQAPEVAAQADVVEQEDVEMQDAPAVDERVASSSAVVSTSTGAEQNRPATPEEGPQAAGAPATQASLQSDKDRLWDQLGSESESELPPLCTDGPDAE